MKLDSSDFDRLENSLCRLALAAGERAMEIYNSGIVVHEKSDASPVTEADRAGEAIILKGLRDSFPDIPVLAEESASDGNIPELGDIFFLVDPLDGTKEFINKTGEFTVNIALIENGRPKAGVVYAPALQKLYFGIVSTDTTEAASAWVSDVDADFRLTRKTPIAARIADPNELIAVASRSHRSPETETFLGTLSVTDFKAAGSSLKFCLIAEGQADIYPRFGRTMEWDTGAGQAVLEAAGGTVVEHPDIETSLGYRKVARGFDNPHFIALGASPEIIKS